VRLVVGDVAVCKRHLQMSVETARQRLGAAGDVGAALIGDLERWLNGNRELVGKTTGNPKSWPIWDEITVAHLLGLTESEQLPRPVLLEDRTFDHARARGTVTWITAVKGDALWRDLAACLTSKR
jgi:hypothetical protein